MLGVIHRSVLGVGPAHFRNFFQLAKPTGGQRHRFQLVDIRGAKSTPTILTRSAFGLIAIYNLLPERVFSGTSVKHFQKNLQELVRERAAAGCDNWADTLSPRLNLADHPLQC